MKVTNYTENLVYASSEMRWHRQVVEILTAELNDVLQQPESDQLHWTGSVTDLIETVYAVYEGGQITDIAGFTVPFIRLLEVVTTRLHVSMPGNPYSRLAKARSRKGVYQISVMARFCTMVANGDEQSGLLRRYLE